MKFIIPGILIVVSVVGILIFINPLYSEISNLKAQASSYNEALDNSKALETERDNLTEKYNAISAENLDKLSKLLPNNVDNIRLIIEIEEIAEPYSMLLRDVQYNTTPESTTEASQGVNQDLTGSGGGMQDYGSWDLEFSTQGTYTNFLGFVKSLESNLRLVDISSIEFSSAPVSGQGQSGSSIYKYLFKIKTYWLKD